MKKRQSNRRSIEEENEILRSEAANVKMALNALNAFQEDHNQEACGKDENSNNRNREKILINNSLIVKDPRIQFLANNIPNGFLYQLVIDPTGNRSFSFISSGVKDVFDITPDQAYDDPMHIYNKIHPEDLGRITSYEKLARQEDTSLKEEIKFQKPSSNQGWILLRSSSHLLEDGSSIINGIAIDISDQKQTDEALRLQASEFRQLLKSMASAFVVWSTIFNDNGKLSDIRFEYFNDAYEQVSGLKLDNVKGKTVREIWPTTEEDWYKIYEKVALTGEPQVFELFHSPTNGLYSCCAYRPWNNAERVCCVFENITEKRRAAEALKDSQERVALALQGADLGSWDWNVQTGAIIINDRLAQMLGYEVSEITPFMKNWLELLHPEDLSISQDIMNQHLKGLIPSCEIEFRARHKNGSWIWILSKGKVVTRDSHGDPIRVVGTHLDITERKLAEEEQFKLQDQLQQAMKMEAVGRLAGGVAHDFNNLLTAISGNIELAKMKVSPSDPIAQQLDQAGKAAESAASLTRQLLAFSRRQIIEPQVINLNELITNLQKMLVRLIGEDISFHTTLSPSISSVKIDPGQFEQVIVNLVINARDSMPNGGSLEVETSAIILDSDYCVHHPGTQVGEYVLLSVSDSGHGMTNEVKAHIFEPFFTTKTKGRGTGLGLATIFGIIKQAGGSIEVYSEVGIGSTFKIYLPAIKTPSVSVQKENVSTTIHSGHETILLVEDEEAVRSMAFKILEILGYSVMSAANGLEAISLAKQYPKRIDLLLTDVVMPGMNGRELAQQISTIHPETTVLYTSGYTENVIVDHGVVDAGLNFIGKPYTLQLLAQKIRELLDHPKIQTP